MWNDDLGLCGAGDFRFLALLGMTRWWDCLVFTLTFDSSPIKGEGDWLVVLDLFTCVMRRPVDSRLRGNDGEVCWNDEGVRIHVKVA